MVNAVYNYYLTTYSGNNTFPSNNAHKKSELREVYNNIVRISRKSPLFKLDMTSDVRSYAIHLKESAYALRDVADSIETDSLFGSRKKKASSSDSEKVSAKYISSDNSEEDSDFDIVVSHLATPQINTGNFLPPNKFNLPRGDYSFDINVNEYSYELQFKAGESETNRSLQEKIARLINRSDIGISAEVIENAHGNSALQFTSLSTGSGLKSRIFTIDNNPDNLEDIADYFGLNQITMEPSNAQFLLNGTERFSSGNTFTVNKGFEITLNDITGDEPVHIGFKPDTDSLIDSLNDLSKRYNSIIDLASNTADSKGDTARLMHEINRIAKRHTSSLESIGLSFQQNGHMKVDQALVTQSITDGEIADSLDKISAFKNDLAKEADQITINPMRYVNKTMISYPNPVRSFSNPYVTSIYTGMMFNGYI